MIPAVHLHFLVGSTGAGKTTYAKRFCTETGAVLFSIDEWMTTLFWMDSPQPLQPAWSMERIDRCSQQIWDTAVQVARAGVACMLEVGFASRACRRKYAELANKAGLTVQLHVLDVPIEDRWERIRLRNQQDDGQGQLSFPITREMFDFTERFWEPPTPDEVAEFVSVYVTS
ncbi:ATP-binding protein [Caulobacter sp. S45]|uniref:AAA family ATPase n=1 Tax=Caulobacter sp. S45 TaxID=1641861 RepID=UPI001575DE8B